MATVITERELGRINFSIAHIKQPIKVPDWFSFLDDASKRECLEELVEAFFCSLEKNDFSLVPEVLEDWEETAYIYSHPELADEIDKSIAESKLG